MKNIEKTIEAFAAGKAPRIGYQLLLDNKDKTSMEFINILFRVINEKLDNYNDSDLLVVCSELLKDISIIVENGTDINRKTILKKLWKLDHKISRIEIENAKSMTNKKKVIKRLESIREVIDEVCTLSDDKETKQYRFTKSLVDGIRDINYLEKTFHTLPSLVNVETRDKKCIFREVVEKYLKYLLNDDLENINYYSNVISLMLIQNSLDISNSEKKAILEEIRECTLKLSITKKKAKINKEKIKWLDNLVNTIKTIEEVENNISDLASRHNIEVSFDEVLKTEAKLCSVPTVEDDRFFVDDYVITIDRADTVEVDDALSCKRLENGNYLLGVHIASILSYFPYDSEIVDTAISRVSTIYLPNVSNKRKKAVIPMFPLEFSSETASLLPGLPKFTRSYFFEIDKDGNIVNEKFIKSIIKSDKKTTYKEINNILENGTNNPQLQELVTNLFEVTNILDKKFKPSALYENVKENSSNYSDLKVKRVGSEKMVYLAMLLTGNRVASFFANSNGYPCLYRTHEVNQENNEKFQALIDNLTETYGGDKFRQIYEILDGLYPKGTYGLEGSHYGLGLDHYCHCTSGLRRAADIVVEHALEVCYDKEPTDEELIELKAEIERRATEINNKSDSIDWFIKDYTREKTYKKK